MVAPQNYLRRFDTAQPATATPPPINVRKAPAWQNAIGRLGAAETRAIDKVALIDEG
jgi:hypothetical protein